MSLRWPLWLLALLSVGAFVYEGVTRLASGPLEAARLRSLSHFRAEAWPDRLPAPWRAELERALSRAPAADLLDPSSLELARQLLAGVSWVAPDSIQVQLALPDGIELRYRPRRPLLAVLDHGRRVGVAEDLAVLPAGLPDDLLAMLAVVPLDPDASLPVAGRAVADPLVQEAVRAAPEFYALRDQLHLDLVGIERRPGYPRASPGVPPALAFRTRDGIRISWGRAVADRDPGGMPVERKILRLRAVLAEHPGLRGLENVEVDLPRVHLYGPDGGELPIPEVLQ